jgi:hypothetical protein
MLRIRSSFISLLAARPSNSELIGVPIFWGSLHCHAASGCSHEATHHSSTVFARKVMLVPKWNKTTIETNNTVDFASQPRILLFLFTQYGGGDCASFLFPLACFCATGFGPASVRCRSNGCTPDGETRKSIKARSAACSKGSRAVHCLLDNRAGTPNYFYVTTWKQAI